MASNSEKVKRFLKYYSIPVILVELNESTRTSQMAADVLGCSVAQIAKSIVFVNSGDKAVVVVISGDKRVDDRKLSKMLGHKVTIADADAVRKYTGYAIGGRARKSMSMNVTHEAVAYDAYADCLCLL